MKNSQKLILFTALISLANTACTTEMEPETIVPSTYTGTASLSQGMATVTTENLFECSNGREAPVGISTALDGNIWTVPAMVNFTDNSFPFASDLYNPCSGIMFNSENEAVAAMADDEIIEVDANGEVITAFVFADNYFEMYINGIPVGKDKVPFTQFNSSILRFRVSAPYTIAMKLVDWEENSGLGSESNQGSSYYPGDGGMVAVFKNESNEIVARTGSDWKAQTFYTSPIKDLSCPTENGSLRLTNNCNIEGSNDGSSYYALHWDLPTDWYAAAFDDSSWPSATTYTNSEIGVNNKASYTNFTSVFDAPTEDAEFIWSTNVVLDNEVIVRFTVD
ncbi:hypothetical protein [Cyclobacterium qasimii]|uniref:Uncharacterized protein n=2 Tax=Bacteroidota TaxID=976 RepID=S7WFZ4_9BACT|nr:hypothetical protein [Cyclobacterium qasimii]EPR65669.1 putative protein-signal peptide and transmembrane prediction [Cyclobacterium qasimii M12-11B]